MTEITSISDLASKAVNEALSTSDKSAKANADKNGEVFADLLSSAMGLIKNTNDLSNAASVEQMNFAMGYSDNTHDLAIAQQKAALSLQYTVAVKNKVIEAYKEIMNMQI